MSQVWFPTGMPQSLADLASVADDEDWGAEHTKLRTYLRHTWRRLVEERKVIQDARDGHGAGAFHTGLFTSSRQPVYGFLQANSNPGRQPWVLREWATAASPRMSGIDVSAVTPAFYFDEPADVVFDRRLPVIPDVEHIVDDNVDRFPAELRQDAHRRRLLLEAAVKDAACAAAADWRVAVPQYYRTGVAGPGRVQLLLPMCLTRPGEPDLALALERTATHYRAHTVLTLDMAAANARLLSRPSAPWLPLG